MPADVIMSLRSPRSGRGYRRVFWHDPVVLLGYPHATVFVTGAIEGGLRRDVNMDISWMLRVPWKLHHMAIAAVHCASGIGVVSNRWLWKLEWVISCLFANAIANKPGWGLLFSLPLPPPCGWLDGGLIMNCGTHVDAIYHINWCFITRGILSLLLLRVSNRHLCLRD